MERHGIDQLQLSYKLKALTGNSIIVFVGTLILMHVSFINGFPLHYLGDTATYIKMGFTKDYGDAIYSMYYPFFIYYTSFQYSLWLPVFIQSLLLTLFLWEVHHHFIKTERAKSQFLFVVLICLLAFFTPISKVSSRLMPDVFTPIGILANFLLVFGKGGLYRKVLYGLALCLSILCHSSHFLLFLFSNFLFGTVALYYKPYPLIALVKRIGTLFLLVFLSLGIQVFTQFHHTGEWFVSKSSHVYLMDKLSEFGILQSFLTQDYNLNKYPISAYSAQLKELGKGEFMWNRNLSPLYLHYGDDSTTWQKSKPEYSQIIKDVFRSKKYVIQYAVSTSRAAVSQLFMFHFFENQGTSHGYTYYMQLYFPQDYAYYETSLQFTDTFKEVDSMYFTINNLSFFLTLIGIAYCLIFTTNPEQTTQFLFVSGFVIINAFLCAGLSFTQGRYHDKVWWLLLLLIIYQIYPQIEKRFSQKTS